MEEEVVESKTLTLKLLEKQSNTKFDELEKQIQKLSREIEVIKKSLRK